MKSSVKQVLKELQDYVVNRKFVKEMDDLVHLWKTRKIENPRTALNLAEKLSRNGRGATVAARNAITKINSFKSKQPATGKLERQYQKSQPKKTWLIKGEVTVKSKYYRTTKKTGDKTLLDKEYEDKLIISHQVQASSKEEAEEVFKKRVHDEVQHEEGDGDSNVIKSSKVQGTNVTSAVAVDNPGQSEAHSRMRKASYVRYGFVPSEDKYLKHEGFCVVDNFVGMYSPHIKKLTREYFEQLVTKVKTDVNTKNDDLDFGIDFGLHDGITPLELMNVCELLHISMYAYDITNKNFLKYVVPQTQHNYPPLVYYAIGNHMYLIENKEKAISLIRKSASSESKIKSVVLEEDYKSKNRYDGLQLYSDVSIKDLAKCKDGANIINKTHLNDELIEYIKIYNTIPTNMKNHKIAITEFHDEIHNVIVAIDPNDTKKYNYKMVKQICDEKGIEFANQSFPSVVKQMRNKFMKVQRQCFSKEFRAGIYESQNKCCQLCSDKLKPNLFHIDHIIALANGGNNEIDNLQILCKECHYVKTKDEADEGWVRTSDTESSFNSETSQVFESELSRSWAFVEKLDGDYDESKKLFGFDINRCRKNCMYYNKFDYPLFTVMDKVEDYRNDCSKPGLYYVECSQYFPLRGNGWYSQPEIKYCLDENLISSTNIKYVIYSSLTIKHNYFNEFIDYLYDELKQFNTEDLKFDKLAVNSMIGAFKPKMREEWKSLGITTNINNAFYHYLQHKGCFIDGLDIADTKYFQIFDKYTKSIEETEAPIYNMILGLEAIELHKLSEIIKAKGGRVLDTMTDCITCTFLFDQVPFELDDINVKGYEFADGVPKYKLEEKESRVKVELMKQHIRTDTYTYKPKEWKIIEDCNDNNFQPFVNSILDNNMNINIDGLAGTGKSTLIHQLQDEMQKRNIKYAAVAPSNKAARKINGTTIHKFIKKHPSKVIKELNIDYMIVDEISMVHEIFYKYLLVLQRLKPSLRFIIAGNFDQLLPVKDRISNVDYEHSVALHDLCSGNRLVLTTCRRADDECFKKVHPSNIHNLRKSDFKNKMTGRHLSYTNKKRKEINEIMMKDTARNKRGKKILEFDKVSYDKDSQSVRLVSGTPIISRINKEDMDIFNNETFVIKEIQHSKCNILIVDDEDDKRMFNIPFNMFQKMFYVAYCITIHKSQGQTFDFPYTIHEWNHPRFNSRLKYVALSRTTNLQNINVM
jgi:hypothetical protein